MRLEEYQRAYAFAAVERSTSGVLTVRLHTNGQALVWNAHVHRRLPQLLQAISSDRDTRVVVLAGTGDEFIHYPAANTAWITGDTVTAAALDDTYAEARHIVEYLIDIEVPVVAAVNGPAHAHCELALLSDIVICAEDASFADLPHFPSGVVPGDGIQTVLCMLLGPNRARHLMLTGASFSAAQAKEWGVVAETTPRDAVMRRAQELGEQLATANPLVLRYTRQVFMQPFRRAFAESLVAGMALETIANLSYRELRRDGRP